MNKKEYLDKSASNLLRNIEEDKLIRKATIKEQHKCNNCEWAKWNGEKVFCMFPTCFKDI